MAARLGSGTLMAALAARGVQDPAGMVQYLSGESAGTYAFAANEEFGGQGTGTCPSCGYQGRSSSFGISGASLDESPGALRTPAPGTGYVRKGAPLTVKGGGSAPGLSNIGDGVELANRLPVTGPSDIVIARGDDGTAIVRHRMGGHEIGRIANNDGWRAMLGDKAGAPHTHQRAALQELLGIYNRGVTTMQREAQPAMPLQAPPQQTQLMQQMGIPAVRAFATTDNGSSDGPRTTMASGSDSDDDGDDDGDDGGLTPRGKAIFAKLKAKGMKPRVAMAMARRSQNGPPGSKS